jgi:hypothetical protein
MVKPIGQDLEQHKALERWTKSRKCTLPLLAHRRRPYRRHAVLQVWNAKQVFVSKRDQGTGYSGIENPLFYKDNTRMYYGDAKKSVSEFVAVDRVTKTENG